MRRELLAPLTAVLLFAGLTGAAGCATSASVVVTVDAAAGLTFTGITGFDVTFTNAGATGSVAIVQDVPVLPTDFELLLRDAEAGALEVCVTAAGGTPAGGTGCSTVDLVLGGRVEVTVLLSAAGCGDGTAGPGEACDGADLGAEDCMTQGFASGTLACAGDCTFDTSGCVSLDCGDATIDAGEECDGAQLGGNDCTTIGKGFLGGTLGCGPTCVFDVTGCTDTLCGNGVVDTGEVCDGSALDGQTCETLVGGTGVLACLAACEGFDNSGCEWCGNGTLGGAEACEGADLGGATCTSEGFDGGTLGCTGACAFDTSACTTCGNTLAEPGEACDGMDLGGNDCTTAGAFDGGTLSCTSACAFDTSACTDCGDGAREGTESCDGSDLGGATCASIGQGFVGGTLGCLGDCSFDTSGCTAPPACGNGVVDTGMGEECDLSATPSIPAGATCTTETGLPSGSLACTGGCTIDGSGCYACGDGALDGPEACDGANLGGASCVTLGHDGGALSCAASCLGFNEAACTDCGDGVAEGAEVCDGADLGGATCASSGFVCGMLQCNATCSGLDTSMCDATPPSIPVQRLPMNNAYVGSPFVTGSRRPTFAWQASLLPGCPGVPITYELQYSDSAAFGAGAVTEPTASTSFTPASDLAISTTPPVGRRWYWRVRACAGSVCSVYSPVWWVNAGRDRHDYNGDGYADVVVGAPGKTGPFMELGLGSAWVFLGGPSPIDTGFDSSAPDLVTPIFAGAELGTSVAWAGDLNADGFSDLAVGATYAGEATAGGAVFIYLGTPTPPYYPPADITLDPGGTGDLFGRAVAGVGDVNRDGYDDLGVGAPNATSFGVGTAGVARLYLGGPSGPDTTADAAVAGPSPGAAFGSSIAGAGDMNGDGYADVVVGAPGVGVAPACSFVTQGAAYVYFGGGAGGFDAVPDGSLDEPETVYCPTTAFGHAVAVGDGNGDGFSDVVVCDPLYLPPVSMADGQCWIYRGAAGGAFDTMAEVVVSSPASGAGTDAFGYSVAAGDVNGDGLADLIVGARLENIGGITDRGRVWLFATSGFGVPTGTALMDGDFANDQLGTAVAFAGDVNGDGAGDILAGAPLNDGEGTMPNAGQVHLSFGCDTGALECIPDASVDAVFPAPNPNGDAVDGDLFGSSVH